jgi:predicted nucleic acid-binding Zn ribbon protein
MDRRRPMRRLSELLPEAAAQLGIEDDLHRARVAAAWERTIAEHVPAALGSCVVVGLEAGGLVVAADEHAVAQELRLRAPELLAALIRAPGVGNLRGIRIVVQRHRSPTVA